MRGEMTTFTFKPGAAYPLTFEPIDDAGNPIDLSGAAMQLRVTSGSACIVLDAVIEDGKFVVDLNDLTLPPRPHSAALYFDWGEGWRKSGEINLLIEGGC